MKINTPIILGIISLADIVFVGHASYVTLWILYGLWRLIHFVFN